MYIHVGVCVHTTLLYKFTLSQCHVVSVVYVEGGLGMVMYRVA